MSSRLGPTQVGRIGVDVFVLGAGHATILEVLDVAGLRWRQASQKHVLQCNEDVVGLVAPLLGVLGDVPRLKLDVDHVRHQSVELIHAEHRLRLLPA